MLSRDRWYISPVMALDFLFDTDRFNLSEAKPHLINPCCYGKDPMTPDHAFIGIVRQILENEPSFQGLRTEEGRPS